MNACRGSLNASYLGHDVGTVTEMGWSGIKNGPLLRRAAPDFEAFLTVDQGLEYQQNLFFPGPDSHSYGGQEQ